MTPFRPTPASTIRITAVTGGNPVQLAGLAHGSGVQVRVRNRGTVEAFIEFGGNAVTAAAPGANAGSMGLAVGAIEVFTIQQTERWVAVAVESGSPSIEITVGGGE